MLTVLIRIGAAILLKVSQIYDWTTLFSANYLKINLVDTCAPSPELYYSDITYAYDLFHYGPDNARTFAQCETLGTYHIAADYKKNHVLIYDFGCEAAITEFVFRNSNNRGINDRLVPLPRITLD